MEQAISSDLIRGHIDTIILHTLLDGDKFAQQISDFIELKSDGKYKINQATLYSSLKRLESLKHVKAYLNDSPNGRRKFFKLTDLGKTTVETNLSSWSYSRAIIDKLMDCQTDVVVKTEYIEKIIEKPVEVIVEKPIITERAISTPINPINSENHSVSEHLNQKNSEPIKSSSVEEQSNQELNFRSILNGLIRTNNAQKTTQNEELVAIDRIDVVEPPIEVESFNQTINSINYNENRNNNGKIDFGDLTLKAAKEGYKIRISSKDSCLAKGSLLINKLNFTVSGIMFILSVISLFLVWNFMITDFIYRDTVLLGGILLFSIIPFINLVKLMKNPKATSTKTIAPDDILTMGIIAFNIGLISVALNLIYDISFFNLSLIALTFVLPISIAIFLVINAILKVVFSKLKSFKIKNN
jgi:PadR family transcriptional regulator PadR